MSKRLTGLNPLAYMGVEPLTPAATYNQLTDPTVNDFQGFNLGDIWVNKVGPRGWMYFGQKYNSMTMHTDAIWLELAASGTVGASSFVTDSGTAITTAGGVIDVFGGNNIHTTGSSNTVTVNVSGTTQHAVQIGNATNSLTSLAVGTNGQVLLGATTADPAFGTLTSTGGTIVFTTGANTLNLETASTSMLNLTGDQGPATSVSAVGIKTNDITNGGTSIFLTSSTQVELLYSDGVNNTGVGSNSNERGAGERNSGFGSGALQDISSGTDNCSLGFSAGDGVTTGDFNISIGSQANSEVTTGSYNIAIGNLSGNSWGTGGSSSNIAISNRGIASESHVIRLGTTGSGTGQQTTCYLAGNVHVDEGNLVLATTNTGPTVGVIYSNTDTLLHTYGSFSNNLFLGINAGNLSNATQDNIAIGSSAGADIATGSGNNIMIGNTAGSNLTTGNHNVIIGAGAGTGYITTESDNIVIGSVAGTAGDQDVIRIGNAQTTCFIAGIRGVTTINDDAIAVLVDSSGQLGTVSSSRVYKENIIDMRSQSEGIMSLRPVTFNYKKDERKSKQYGLIAEEVAETMPDLVVYNAEGTPETVKYHILVPLLLNEVQRMNERILELEDKNCRN